MAARNRFSDDSEGVSPVVGTVLAVSITVVLAGVVFLVSDKTGTTSQHEQITFYSEERGSVPGGVLTVISVVRGPIVMENLAVGGTSHSASPCTWSRATGPLQAGDQLTCTQGGTITITDIEHKFLLYSGSFT